MTDGDRLVPSRFRLLGAFVAGRPIEIAEAPKGQPAHTDGHVVFVSAGCSAERWRHQAVLQCALLGAGSLDPHLVKPLRGQPSVARRYLAVEGRRVLAALADRLPSVAALETGGDRCTSSSVESLERARGRTAISEAPDWFGVIRPALLLTAPRAPGAPARESGGPAAEENDAESESGESRILKLFSNPLTKSQALENFLRKLLGESRSAGDSAASAEMHVGSVRKVSGAGPTARPIPTRIHFTDDDRPGATFGVGGALHPEWDVHRGRYRRDWCRVIDFPMTVTADVSVTALPRDEILRQRLRRIGLAPKVLRGRPDGDELDVEALIDLYVDLRSGYSPSANVYLERRWLARDLGVLILLDASGSTTDADPAGFAVHEHQRQAAGTLAATLEELGDRVAVYAFRSHGRRAVHLPTIKTFGQPFGAGARIRLNCLEPSGYTRLGAGIRGAGEILKREAGSTNRLLLVLSDGFPYDDGYEGPYAEADVARALAELRTIGVACLCLSIGSAVESAALGRVFGSASHASGVTLGDLSQRMDELFLSALRELAVAK